MNDLQPEQIQALTQSSKIRQVPVTLYELTEEPITIYVSTTTVARSLKESDRILWTLRERREWEKSHPIRNWLWTNDLGCGPDLPFSSNYPES